MKMKGLNIAVVCMCPFITKEGQVRHSTILDSKIYKPFEGCQKISGNCGWVPAPLLALGTKEIFLPQLPPPPPPPSKLANSKLCIIMARKLATKLTVTVQRDGLRGLTRRSKWRLIYQPKNRGKMTTDTVAKKIYSAKMAANVRPSWQPSSCPSWRLWLLPVWRPSWRPSWRPT